jgi:hypothetical protein
MGRDFLNYIHAQLPGWIGGGIVQTIIAFIAQRVFWSRSPAMAVQRPAGRIVPIVPAPILGKTTVTCNLHLA